MIVETAVFTINKKAVTVTADNKSSVYGSDFEELTFTVPGESLVEGDTADDLAVTLTKAPGTDVGDYAITGESASVNYDVTVTPGTYTITQASLTVTANDNTITYGDAPTDNGVSCSGFVDGESERDLGGTLIYSYSYTQYGKVGTYSITPSGFSSGNYAISYVDGELTVGQRTVELSWSTLSADALVYDGTAKILSASVANKAQDTDDVSVTAVLTGDNENVTVDGFYYTASGLTGTDSGNYRLPSDNASDVCRITASSLSTGDFVVTQIDGDTTVTLDAGGNVSINFTGSAIVPTVAVADGSLVASTPEDYTVSCGDNTAVGIGTVKITGQGNFTGELVYTFAIIDQVAPMGSLTIAENTWNKCWNDVTFDLFYNATQTVTVTASDGESGVAKTEYYLANAAAADASELAEVTWTEFTDSFSIAPENSYVVYVKITDNSGNSTIINSDGVVLETTAPAIDGLEDGRTYCADVTFTVSDDNLDYVLIDGEKAAGELAADTDGGAASADGADPDTAGESFTGDGNADGIVYRYTIPADNDDHTVQAFDKAGNATAVYTVTVNNGHTWEYTAKSADSGSGEAEASKAKITETCIHCGESASVTISAPSGEQVYDGDVHDAVLSCEGELSGGSSLTVSYTWSATEDGTAAAAADTTQAGIYTASVTYGGETVSVTYMVERAEITIAADDVTRGYGDSNPSFTFQVTEGELAAGDTKDDLGVTLSTAAGEDSAAGTYAITGTSDSENYEVTIVEGTMTVVVLTELPEQEFPDTDAEHRVVMLEGLTEVPEALKDNPNLDTAEEIEALLKTTVCQQNGYAEGNTIVYEVTLMVSFDGGMTWEEAAEESFPADGLTLLLPYPEGTGKDTHDFAATHMFTSTAFGKTPGDTENPAVTKTDEGLLVTVTGLSPIVVAWEEISVQGETDESETEALTESEIETSTEGETEALTEGETEALTEGETEALIEGETEAPTEARTEKNESADSGSVVSTESETESEAETETSVQTGDNTPVEFYRSLLILALAVILGTIFIKNRRKIQRKS